MALIAMMFATISFSVDAMLPVLPEMIDSLQPKDPNRIQLVLTAFILGMGLGTFVTGPLSDSFGRKRVVLASSVLYIVGAGLAAMSQNLELMLAARLVQGLGAAGPRVVALAIIRDLLSGREMARTMSFIMVIFTLVPAMAPTIGAGLAAFSGWRGIFVAFVIFTLIFTFWMQFRLQETLPIEARRPFRLSTIWAAAAEMMALPRVRLSILAQSFAFGILFSTLSSTQQIFDITFDQAENFPLWFGLIAALSGSSSLLNAWLVGRLGMHFMVTIATIAQLVGALLIVLYWLSAPTGAVALGVFVVWQTSIFFQTGMVIGNLNAIAMEPVGHIAGSAASIIGAVATVISVILAIPVGLMFDGTPMPLAVGILVQSALALVLMLRMGPSPQTVSAE